MELWFIMAVGGALFSGVAAFGLKIAAQHNFDSELSILYSSIFSATFVTPLAFFIAGLHNFLLFPFFIALVGGILAAMVGIFKIYALRHIDTTIYFPLFKLVSPALAIVLGILLFQESFNTIEWFGIALSLFVPLLLITKGEHSRQNNLIRGLILVLVTGIIAALVATINKYATDLSHQVLWLMVASSTGVFIGSLGLTIYKRGHANIVTTVKEHTNRKLLFVSITRSLFISTSFGMTLYAFVLGGTLGVVQTIHSLYILVPIVLAICLYKEHWNLQKVAAIVLSIAALVLLA